jgi:hypothetical protein
MGRGFWLSRAIFGGWEEESGRACYCERAIGQVAAVAWSFEQETERGARIGVDGPRIHLAKTHTPRHRVRMHCMYDGAHKTKFEYEL